MRKYNRNDVLISQHIPKTAGTSFTNVLHKWFWPGFHAHYYRHETNEMPFKPMMIKNVAHQLRVFPLCIHGHFEEEAGVFETYPKASQFITVLRDPLDLQLSLFFDHQRRLKDSGALYWKGNKVEMEFDGDIDKWVEERPCFILKFFPWHVDFNNYRQILDENFVHVGVTEDMQKSINIFAEKLGKKSVRIDHLNPSPRWQTPSEAAIRKFQNKHQLEYAMYHYACRLNAI
jgi:hypothetical protein